MNILVGRAKELRIDGLLRRGAVLGTVEIVGEVDDVIVQELLGIFRAHGES